MKIRCLKHPAEDFLIATREERARSMVDMPPMISVPLGLRILSPGLSAGGPAWRIAI